MPLFSKCPIFLIEMQKSKPTEGHNFHLFEQVLSFFLYFIFPCTELAVKFLLIQIGTIIEKFFLAVLFFWRKVVHLLLFFTKNEKNGSYNIIICSGLLVFCNVGISHGSWPQIAAFRIIRQKLHNSSKIANCEERTRKYSLLT